MNNWSEFIKTISELQSIHSISFSEVTKPLIKMNLKAFLKEYKEFSVIKVPNNNVCKLYVDDSGVRVEALVTFQDLKEL